ncbi:class F sortase [Blastococcus haudaquaticus]|uniref:Sortase family protein n=1 Tax=Blastococcus haudaquaticus TaxID=1938745 RepID=A0A286GCH6_9ACTN|nr:class F sortase [Blastococcus haudaquaticus]SOD93210.1 Sortase family protein [Blastococcus haudaquaticus]
MALLLAAPAAPAAGAAETGQLRIAHLSPDSPAVDVALAPLPPGTTDPLTDPGEDLATGLAYGTVSDPVPLAPGSYAVSVRAAGADRTVPPVVSTRIDLTSGEARTVTLGGAFADLALQTLTDDLSAPPAGSARVRVVAAAGAVPALDVAVRGGPSLVADLPLGAAGEPGTVPEGPALLVVSGGTGPATEVPISFAAASVVTLLVLDSPAGGLLVRPVVDAAAPAVVPVGGVEAGTGPLLPGSLLPAGVLLAGLAAARRGRVLLAATGVAVALLAGTPGTAGAVPVALRGPAPPEVEVVAGAPAPDRLVVPSAGVDAALIGAGPDAEGALVPPADPAVAGWYTEGPAPGETGPAVVTGHVDWAGAPGVFAGLAAVDAGAEIRVVRADGSTALFTVTRVERAPKTAFPTTEVYGPTSGAELRLITCGGVFDRSRGSYEDNVVVFARAVG